LYANTAKGDVMKKYTSIRVSGVGYASLLKVRGMLETVHQKRLSFDDAMCLSANFTCAVLDFVMKNVQEDNLVVTVDDNDVLHFVRPDGSVRLPAKVCEALMRTVRELSKVPPTKGAVRGMKGR